MDELIEIADNLCERLDKASQDDINFHFAIQKDLEIYSWEVYKLTNYLKKLNEMMESYYV